MILDLHVHTKYSGDASINPRELFTVAKARGLDGIAVTDHDTTRGWTDFSGDDDFIVIQGIERTTDHGSVIGLFLNEEIDAYGFWDAVDQIRGQGGIVVLPHPCDAFRRDTPRISALDTGLLKARIDAVEVFNSRCIFGRSNERAERLAEELGKHRLGGSDAHTLGEVGRARTRFSCGSPEEIHDQLNKNVLIDTVVQGRLSSRLVHFSSILNRLQK